MTANTTAMETTAVTAPGRSPMPWLSLRRDSSDPSGLRYGFAALYSLPGGSAPASVAAARLGVSAITYTLRYPSSLAGRAPPAKPANSTGVQWPAVAVLLQRPCCYSGGAVQWPAESQQDDCGGLAEGRPLARHHGADSTCLENGSAPRRQTLMTTCPVWQTKPGIGQAARLVGANRCRTR